VQRPGYIVHGLPVRSDFPLPLAQADIGVQPHVEVVRRGPAPVPVPDDPPPGKSYGAVGTPPARSWWSLDGDTWRIRFPGRCELRVAPPWRRVEVDVHVGAPADVVADRIVKTGVLFALERQGRHVLHASAVRIQDATIAFVGTSGSGKSTLAALLCADGGALVSDDQLRVDFAGGDVTCHPGLDALRLRTEVREVAKLLGGGSDSTWDGRTAVLPASVEGPQRLDVLVLPALTTEHDTLRVEALSRPEAMVALAGTRAIPRIPEWLAARFHTHASLVQRLPAFRVLLPFGSVPGADARRALLDRVLASG
jgi:hypothetical protein